MPRSLGSLSVTLVAQVGRFIWGMDYASRRISKFGENFANAAKYMIRYWNLFTRGFWVNAKGVTYQIDSMSERIKRFRMSFHLLRESTKWAMASMVALGAVWTRRWLSYFTALGKESARFQELISRTATLMTAELAEGFSSTASAMRYLGREVMDLKAKFGIAAEDVAMSLYDAVSSLYAARDAVKILDAAGKLAVSGLSTMREATNAIITVLKAWKRPVEDAAEVADVLMGVIRRGRLTMDQLSEGLRKTAGLAAGLGMSFEEVASSVALLTRAGIPAAQTFTAIRNAAIALIRQQKEGYEVLAKYGILLRDTTDKEGEFFRIILALAEHALPSETAAVFRRIRALLGTTTLVGRANELMEDALKIFERSTTVQEAFNARIVQTQLQLKKLSQAYDNLRITAGQNISLAMGPLAGALAKESPEWAFSLPKKLCCFFG